MYHTVLTVQLLITGVLDDISCSLGGGKVDQAGATKSLIILFGAVVMFVGSLIISQWQMNKTLAYTLLITYIIYVIYTIVSAAFF